MAGFYQRFIDAGAFWSSASSPSMRAYSRGAANVHSPTFAEQSNLPAGISHWQFGMFDLCKVNPPLPRMVAAVPVLFTNFKSDWTRYRNSDLAQFGSRGRSRVHEHQRP